jgi:hypothetical protein
MTTLSQEILKVRRLLHDANSNYWSDAELTDYINDGRNRVVADTGCNRVLQTLNLVLGQESYAYSALPQGAATIDILNVTVLWGSMRIPLNYMPFTEFNAKMRTWQGFTSRPVVFTIYGQNSFMLGPIPDQVYVSEIDTVVAPTALVNGSDMETIVFPYVEPVAYYAAYLAKYKEQSYDEAQKFHDEYQSKVFAALRSAMTRRLPSVY